MIGRILVVVVLVALVLAGWTGYQALQVKEGFETVAAEVEPAVGDLQAGDVASVRGRLATVQDGAAQAAENSRGPGWWLAARAPVFGDDVEAVRTVADASDVLASGVLPDVVRASVALESINPYDGPDAVEQLERAARSLARADRQLRRQERRVAAIDVDELDPRLAEPVGQMQRALSTASDFLDGELGQAREVIGSLPAVP